VEPFFLPYDFLYLYDWATYFRYTEEVLQLYPDVPKPPKRIIWDPEKFNRFLAWAKSYRTKEHNGRVCPFGKTFSDEDDFYEFYEN
jgi:hypothetical protein